MLGLLLIYFVGKYYYELAILHNKNKWLYTVIGIATYYGGTFLFGLSLAFYDILTYNNITEGSYEMVINLISIPFGILACWLLYKYLKQSWSKSITTINSQHFLDDDSVL